MEIRENILFIRKLQRIDNNMIHTRQFFGKSFGIIKASEVC
jgi:hypothetical protein